MPAPPQEAHGEITLDKPSKDTSVTELNEIVIEEYRRPLAERRKAEGKTA